MINGVNIRAIVDTGSPFLIIPSVCTKLWGCLTNEQLGDFYDSGLNDTIEIYGGQFYNAQWKIASVKLRNLILPLVTFALVGEDIMRPPGGVFLGLIKYKTNRIRPTFLSQTKFRSIAVNLASMQLKLAEDDLIKSNISNSVIPLIDLRKYGDPVQHYAARIKELYVNGRRIGEKFTLYGVFDTGTSGCVFQDELFNDENTPNPPRSVKAIFETEDGGMHAISAEATHENILVVTASPIKWFTKNIDKQYPPRVIVFGLAFFTPNRTLTIDIDASRLQIS
jgi:hypothetical protein